MQTAQFKVVCSVTWPSRGGEAGVELHMKSSEVCIKKTTTSASLPHKGLVTKNTTQKWANVDVAQPDSNVL